MRVLARHVRFITAYSSHCDFAAYLLVSCMGFTNSNIFSVYSFSMFSAAIIQISNVLDI